MKTVVLNASGCTEPVEIAVERAGRDTPDAWTVTIDGRAADVEFVWTGDDTARLRVGSLIYPMRVVRDGADVALWLAGRTYRFEHVARTAQRAVEAEATAAGNELTAPMPGKVLRIETKPGAVFEADATLIMLESMKMEMAISASGAGKVREILCAEGDLVEMGQLLARLEPVEKAS